MKYETSESWVSIFEAASVEEAIVVKGMLEAAKIPVVLDRDSATDSFGMNSIMNEVVIKVPRDKVSKASQLLQQSKQYSLSRDY